MSNTASPDAGKRDIHRIYLEIYGQTSPSTCISMFVLPSSHLITALFPNFSFLRNSFQEKYSIKMQTWPYVLPSRIEHVRINQAHLLIFLFLIPCKELRRISRAERSMGTYEGN